MLSFVPPNKLSIVLNLQTLLCWVYFIYIINFFSLLFSESNPSSVPIPSNLVYGKTLYLLHWAAAETSAFFFQHSVFSHPGIPGILIHTWILHCSAKIWDEVIHRFWIPILFLPPFRISLNFQIEDYCSQTFESFTPYDYSFLLKFLWIEMCP